MDLYSAARRLNEPFVFGTEPKVLPIGARGVIGDGRSAALVRADGVIDWLCFPRFDSPSVFGAILNEGNGAGETGITPVARPFMSRQRYDPDTNVLETLFEVPGQGVVRLTDYMPWTGDPRLAVSEVHRRIQCVEGEVELELTFDPRFDFGRSSVKFEVSPEGVLATGSGGERMVALASGAKWVRSDDPSAGMTARIKMKNGDRRWMILSWNAPRAEPVAAYRPYEQLRQTRIHWRRWVARLTYEGPWRHHVVRSALVLKLLQYAPTGAMVAAPTTSLPEWIGGSRNWDYRYSWIRDSAMAIRSATLIGAVTEARDFFHFVRDALGRRSDLQIMYTLDGGEVPDEVVLEHLSGYRGSGPVRVGNGARDQIQHDVPGELLDAAYVYEHSGGSLTLRAWRSLRTVVESVSERWSEPDHGIWEPRGGVRHNVHSKLMSWLALERGADVADLFGDRIADSWRAEAARVHADVCAKGLSTKRDHFVAAYDHEHVDSALLLLGLRRFVDPKDPRFVATRERIRRELGAGKYLYRYRSEDGVPGDEGAFVLCGFWMTEVLAMGGELDEAQEVFVAHAEASNHLGLLAEEIDPSTGELLGNFPQAFSHLGLINAAARLDLTLRAGDPKTRNAKSIL
ncbi:MAG: GH15 family glucan-1,4-alpha-glucosidase [Polyangiales bacterium]